MEKYEKCMSKKKHSNVRLEEEKNLTNMEPMEYIRGPDLHSRDTPK